MSQTQAIEGDSGTTATPMTESIEAHGGDSIVSWEELDGEQLSTTDDGVVKHLEQPKAEKKAAPKKQAKESDDEDTEVLDAKAETDDEEEEAKADSKDKEEDNDKVKDALNKVKKIKALDGDEELNLSRELKVPVKVDGKSESVELQELINNYSGSVNWNKKFGELGQEKQKFDARVDGVQKSVRQVHDLVQQGKAQEAIEFIAETMGADPLEMWRNTVKQVEQQLHETEVLSEEERRVRDLQEELDYRKRRDAQASAKAAEQQEAQEIEHRVTEVQQKYGMDNESFVQTYDLILEAGAATEDDLTPEFVGQVYQDMQTKERVKSVIDHAVPELEDKDKAVLDLFQVALRDPDLTDQELKQIAAEVYGTESAKRLSRKVEKLQNKSEKTVKNPMKDPVTFDDLD